MIKNGDIVWLCFLFNLKNMNILGELFNFFSSYSINKRGFTNTVSTDQAVFATLNKLKLSILKQSFTTNDQS